MHLPLLQSRVLQRSTRHALLALWATLLICGAALAATFQYAASHVTSKSPAQVWEIMTAYAETCDSGCKYYRPNLIRVTKLSHAETKSRFYTWSHSGSALKDAKYFTEVTIKRGDDGHFKANNRQLDKSDAALIEVLEKKSGLPHSPVFDSGSTTTHTRAEGSNTVITQSVTVHTGAFVGLWASRIREEIRKSVAATFENIGK